MGKCGSCGYSHPHPGEKSCRFSKDAHEKCKEAGVEETRWREFLDLDTLQELAKSESRDVSQFVSIYDFNTMKQADLDRKAQMDKMEHLNKMPTPGVRTTYGHSLGVGSLGGATPAAYLSSPLTPVLQQLSDFDPRHSDGSLSMGYFTPDSGCILLGTESCGGGCQ